ncbi:hypothetical protein BVC93_14350 [Mycobacterium sp. MS1601]|nr:hypothetical protein BVC93_14350 [Mycobacterium sp. MS1601]
MEALSEELAELSGHRNAIDGRIVDIVAEIDRDGLAGNTGYRSIASLGSRVLGTGTSDAGTEVKAEVPQRELIRYAVDLRSLSHGTATFTREFVRYEPCSNGVVGSQ